MLNQENLDIKIKSVLEEPVPQQLIQTRKVAGTDLQYVSGNFVIDCLNRAFGYLWSWSIDKAWVQQSEPKKFKDRATGKEIVTPQVPVAHVIGTLTVFVKDTNGELIRISKTGAGSKSVIGGSSEQESIFKSASTDALKKAASLFGIGAQLYRDTKEQEFFERSLSVYNWDDQTREYYASDITWLENCKKENNFSDDQVDNIVSKWSRGNYKTVNSLPTYRFREFVKYLKAAQKAATVKK